MQNKSINTKHIVIDEKKEIIEEANIFDEENAEETAAKKIWNALLQVILFFDSFKWGTNT